ncbi:MAG: EipB family protein [Alphaproteobacteria bacterium]
MTTSNKLKILFFVGFVFATAVAFLAFGALTGLKNDGLAASSSEFVSEQVPQKAQDITVSNPYDPAIKAGFVPHKALYDIALVSKKSSAQVLNISGQMLYEWSSNCEAWQMTHKFNLVYEYPDMPPVRTTSDFTLYERFDGSTLDFHSIRQGNGQVLEELRGSAQMHGENAAEKSLAEFRLPPDLRFDLAQGTLFPMAHSLAVLENSRAGKRFFSAQIFDGSDVDGPVEINAFLGRAVAQEAVMETVREGLAGKEMSRIDTTLLSSPAQSGRLAFFPLKTQESAADYEMAAIFHENGVISNIVIDYPDFSISQKLVALERVDSVCNS